MKTRVFLSHSVKDKLLVSSFVDLLQAGMDININEIYCTSNGVLPTGELFVEDIKANLLETDFCVFLLSKNFYESRFCLNEMGAAWILNKKVFPILVPPIDFPDIENTAFKGKNAKKILNKNDIVEMFSELKKLKLIESADYSRFLQKLDEFIIKKPWTLLQNLTPNCLLSKNDLLLRPLPNLQKKDNKLSPTIPLKQNKLF